MTLNCDPASYLAISRLPHVAGIARSSPRCQMARALSKLTLTKMRITPFVRMPYAAKMASFVQFRRFLSLREGEAPAEPSHTLSPFLAAVRSSCRADETRRSQRLFPNHSWFVWTAIRWL